VTRVHQLVCKGKGKRIFVQRLVVNTPLRHKSRNTSLYVL